MSAIARLTLLLGAALGSSALRQRRSKARQQRTYGGVDAIYTWGAPASAKPGLRNLGGGGPCFPGVRMVAVTEDEMDLIPKLARMWPFSFEHPRVDMLELDTETNATLMHPCSEASAQLPDGLSGALSLHMPWKYTFHQKDTSSFLFTVSMIGCWLGNAKDFPILGSRVKEGIEAVGWKLVARAFTPGGFLQGGDQYSIFTQHPDTLACIITFQSTLSLRDVFKDMDARSRPFCGIPDTVVHKGFRDHLRNMVRGEEWQSLIRPGLPSCSKVYVAGMSLGGAMTELFSACVQRAPADDEDFAWFNWTKGPARQLPYL